MGIERTIEAVHRFQREVQTSKTLDNSKAKSLTVKSPLADPIQNRHDSRKRKFQKENQEEEKQDILNECITGGNLTDIFS